MKKLNTLQLVLIAIRFVALQLLALGGSRIMAISAVLEDILQAIDYFSQLGYEMIDCLKQQP